jgi:hypothetical protein
MDATQHKMDVDKREMMAKMDKLGDSKKEMKAHHKEMMASLERLNATANAWLEKTEACPEKKEPTPEETVAEAEPQEVLEGVMDEKMIGAAQDRSMDLHLDVWCCRHLKAQTKRDGGFRQEYAATVRWPTRHIVPALVKGKFRRGPGKKCCSGLRGQNKGSRNGKRGRTGKWDRRLERKKTHCEVMRQSQRLEIVRLLVESSIGLREPGDGLLWKCRPLPKRKR